MPKELVYQHQQKLIDECPKCDICGKARFEVSYKYVMANHRQISSQAVYKLCKGPDSCKFHCTCHLRLASKLGATQILHVV